MTAAAQSVKSHSAASAMPAGHVRALRIWLGSIAFLIVAMILVGGATRLTDSGLSITEWQPIIGAIPPLSDADWQEAFEAYKQIPEYTQINRGMSLEAFKSIYWWEWAHRFLGRFIGLVFFVPFVCFWAAGCIPRTLMPKLVGLFVLGGLQGALGWYMVKSGLVDRVDVSQYRLAAHFGVAVLIFGYTLWLILGLGREAGAKPEEVAAAGLSVADLSQADFSKFAALILAPGIPLTHPEPHWSVLKARHAGIEVIGDVELFFRERAKSGATSKIVVVTGTNGKSTTSALTAHLLSAAGQRVALGGNIGKAVLDLEPFAPDLAYILELSSFQIDLTPSLEPDAAALLNITPDHLDRHGTLQNYAAIKARVFADLGAEATAVIGIDDEPCLAIAETLHGPFAVKRLAVGQPVQNGVWADDGVIMEMDGGYEVGRAELEGIRSLRGAHNWQNAAAAYALARSQGLQADVIQQGLKSFAGLAHRMEQVARVGHVLLVNDY